MLKPMLCAAAALLLLAGASVATRAGMAAPAAKAAEPAAAMMAQHITVHVPRITITSTTTIVTAPAAPPPMFREKKADECVKMKKIVGFWVMNPDSIDLMLDDGTRLRARLGSDCPSLGFYAGFYVKPQPDGKICAGRDVLRARSGRSCAIGSFARLVPVK